jgi:hypothetical protein
MVAALNKTGSMAVFKSGVSAGAGAGAADDDPKVGRKGAVAQAEFGELPKAPQFADPPCEDQFHGFSAEAPTRASISRRIERARRPVMLARRFEREGTRLLAVVLIVIMEEYLESSSSCFSSPRAQPWKRFYFVGLGVLEREESGNSLML